MRITAEKKRDPERDTNWIEFGVWAKGIPVFRAHVESPDARIALAQQLIDAARTLSPETVEGVNF